MESLRQRTLANLMLVLVVLQGSPGHCKVDLPIQLTRQPGASIYYFTDYESQTPFFILPCQADSMEQKPITYIYRWEHNGITVFETNSTDGSFKVMQATAADIGNYTCFATNYFGTVVSNTARVQFAFFNESNDAKNYSVNEGHWMRLTCDVPDGQPEPTVSWTRGDGQPVFSNGSSWDPDRHVVQDHAGDLVFLNASLADSGSYECNVQSPVIPTAVYSQEIQVVVEKATDGIPLQPPQILQGPSVVWALLGEKVKLYCLPVGNPTPSVRWGRPQHPSFRAVEGPVLSLPSVQLDDEGLYTCTAWSTDGLEVNRTTTLHVEAAPSWVVKPVDILRVYKDESVNMTCQAHGKPPPEIKWMENGVRQPQYDGALSILLSNLTLDDYKAYQCVASNVHGQITTNALLGVFELEPPLVRPSGIKVIIKSRESVRIEWRPIYDDRLTGFKVKYLRQGSEDLPKRKDCGKTPSCTLRHLRRDSAFQFVVVAVYNQSRSESAVDSFDLHPRRGSYNYTSPVLWNLFNTALYGVIILGVSTPLIMCIVLCIRDQINGYEPDDDDTDDGWGGTGNHTSRNKVEKVNTVHTIIRQQDGAGPSQNNANAV